MTASFVRQHTAGSSTTAGTTIAAAIATAPVAAGNLLVAWVGARNGVAVTGLSKPGGETASWVKVASHSLSGASGELWVIKTTVSWATSTAVTATFASSTGRRSIVLGEFSGVDAVTRGAAGSGTGASSTASATVSSGLVAGDLVLGGASEAAADFYDGIALDTDTTAGSWALAGAVGLRTTFGDVGGLDLSLQYKFITGAAAQTFNAQGTNTVTGPTTGRPIGATVVALRNSNVPPNAPTLLNMTGGVSVNRGAVQRARWLFSDPNAGDVQSAFDLRYRIVGAPTWTDVHQDTFFTLYDFPANSLAEDDYEWQTATYDSAGTLGPYSTSGFFTAADPPDGPMIVYPVDGSTLDQEEHVEWSTPSQDSYQVRRVADDGSGNPAPGTVYFDTGEVVDAVTRKIPLSFTVNNRTEHVEVRVKYSGLWSDWVDVSGDVSFTPPPTPSFVIAPDAPTGSMLVEINNPAPSGGDPAAVYNDVYVTEHGVEQRRAIGVAPGGSWRYWTPISGVDYAHAIRVVAVAANGTTSSST